MTTLSAERGKGGKQTHWTRENVIAAIQRWVALYGEPPRSADWNPSSAKWSASASWRVPRYLAGDPETGEAWPSLNAAKRPFGGKLSEAIKAAGFEPARPGPRNRKDVRPEIVDRQITPEVRAALESAQAEVRDLAERVEVRDRQLARARDANDHLRDEVAMARRAAGRRATSVTKTKTKKVADRAAIRDAVKAARAEARTELNALRLELASARRDAVRDASKVEKAEATISELRAERRELKRDVERASDRLAAAEARTARTVAPALPEVREIVRIEKQVVELPGPEAREVEAARAAVTAADVRVRDADERVARAERRYQDLAEAATGERRTLSASELEGLRSGGPTGEAVLAGALRGVARARREGGRPELKAALYEVASAAVRWRDRLL